MTVKSTKWVVKRQYAKCENCLWNSGDAAARPAGVRHVKANPTHLVRVERTQAEYVSDYPVI